MSRINFLEPSSDSFICAHCGRQVASIESGNRNHCPHCLRSRHVDVRTGDRRSGCRGTMDPVGVWVKEDGEWSVLHRCRSCGFIRANRIASDDNEMLLFAIAALPLSRLPFPAGKTLGSLLASGAAVGGSI
jgi:DNA-directed RNA polymerase subunit RPC12/RpoP